MKYQGLAAAKINLTLDILGRRADGYHLLQSVMQTLLLCDVVEVEPAAQTTLTCDMPGLPCDESNLAWRAWQLMADEFALDAGVKITLHKQIPLGGGLAGGSTDAAQVLLAIDRLFELRLSQERLLTLAARLGADVPFCLLGGTALAEGVGERLRPLADCPELRLLLVNPGFAVSTPAVYRQYDQMTPADTPAFDENAAKTQAMLQALAAGDSAGIRASVFNVLEGPALALHPKLAELQAELRGLGLIPLLCGSGATFMGLAADKKRAAQAAAAMEGKYPFVCVVTTRNT